MGEWIQEKEENQTREGKINGTKGGVGSPTPPIPMKNISLQGLGNPRAVKPY